MGEKAKELMKLQFDKRPGLDGLKHIVRCFNWRQYSLLIIVVVLLVSHSQFWPFA